MSAGTVVMVDEDAEFAAKVKPLLEAKGLKLANFDSPDRALRYLQEQSWNWTPKFFMTELLLKGMSGYAFIRRLVEHYPNKKIPILVVTKLTSFNDRNEAEMAGATRVQHKPLDAEEFAKNVQEILNPKTKTLTITTEY